MGRFAAEVLTVIDFRSFTVLVWCVTYWQGRFLDAGVKLFRLEAASGRCLKSRAAGALGGGGGCNKWLRPATNVVLGTAEV